MAIYNDYPYTNMHEINQNWIIEKVKDSEKKIQDAIRMIDLAMIKLQEAIDAIESMRDDVNLSLEQSGQALEKATQALESLDSIRAELNIVSANANQALVNAQTAISTANEANQKADSAIEQAGEAMDLAQEVQAIAQGADDKATQAQEKADVADRKAAQVSEDLREVVEVQLPTIARVASSAADVAEEARQTAEQAIAQGEAFIAVYGETTFSEIQNAINGRRRIYVIENASLYVVTQNRYPLPNNAGNVLLWIMTAGGTEIITSMCFEVKKSDSSWRKIELKINIGNPENLTTQNKTSIVSAINEINNKSTSMPELEIGTAVQIATYKEGSNRYRVFQKVVDLGSLPNSTSKTIAHGIDKTKVLRYLSIQGTASQEGFGNTLPLPCVTLGSESVSNNIYVAVGGNNVTIATGRDRSAYNGTLVITYVDNTPVS